LRKRRKNDREALGEALHFLADLWARGDGEAFPYLAAREGMPPPLLRRLLSHFRQTERSRLSRERQDSLGFAEADRLDDLLRSTRHFFFRQVIRGRAEESEKGRPPVGALAAELAACGPAEARILVARGRYYGCWEVAKQLCAASETTAADCAERALEWARLALSVAQRVEKEDPAWQGRLRAFALAHVANAERVQCQVRAAEARWEEAEPLWQAGAAAYPGRLDEAQWLSLKASQRIEQRRLTEALQLVEEAEAIDCGALAVTLGLKKGRILEYMGFYDQAIATLMAVGAQLGAEGELRLRLAQRQNLGVNFCHSGQAVAAADLLPELRRLTTERGVALESLRVRWLEGRVAMALGKRPEARAILESVRHSWVELGNSYEMALVSLELAAIYLEEGRTAEVKALAPQLVLVFRSEDGHDEAAKAVGLFCETVRQELATAELARDIVAFLYRAWHDPILRFEEAGRRSRGVASDPKLASKASISSAKHPSQT
jgi:tetratricopeptide (TPR) repeat protein